MQVPRPSVRASRASVEADDGGGEPMTGRLEGKRVVVLLAEGFEDLEFNVP